VGCDQALVTNLNYINGPHALNGVPGGMKIRGRANHRSASLESDDDDDDDMFHHRASRGSARNKNFRGRADIRIGSGIGRDRNLLASANQRAPAGYDSRQAYRDRQVILDSHTRQRSFSPDARPIRTRDPRPKDGWNQPRPPPMPRRGRGGPASRGRGGRQGSSNESYRPMPSAGKKAWNKFRV
jgi:protein AIR1/2